MKTFARKKRNRIRRMQEIFALISTVVFIIAAIGFVGHSDFETQKLEASVLNYK